jgi:hypothetical protein
MSYYYAIDGDDIGTHIEQLLLTDQLQVVAAYSQKVEFCLREIREYIERNGGHCVFCAGDSLFAVSSSLIELSTQNLLFGHITFSAGVGKSSEGAFLALKKAKGLGKRRIEFFCKVGSNES